MKLSKPVRAALTVLAAAAAALLGVLGQPTWAHTLEDAILVVAASVGIIPPHVDA